MEQKDISNLSVVELEALGYRVLKEIEIAKRNLDVVERLLNEKNKQLLDKNCAEGDGTF